MEKRTFVLDEKALQAIIENSLIAESRMIEHCRRELTYSPAQMVGQLNDLLCRVANEKGITLYELCASVVPEISTDFRDDPSKPYTHFGHGMYCETVIKLKPIE